MPQAILQTYPGQMVTYVLAAKDLAPAYQTQVGQIRGAQIITNYQQGQNVNNQTYSQIPNPIDAPNPLTTGNPPLQPVNQGPFSVNLLVYLDPSNDGPSQSPYAGNLALSFIENAPYNATQTGASAPLIGGTWHFAVNG